MKVIIAGGGFGGLRLARKLNNKPGFEVTLLDRFNFHQFQPLFYQVATAGLDASNISFPLRKAFHKSKNVRVRLGELREVVTGEKGVTDNGDISYDALVIATGAGTNFFGNQQLQEHAFPMKSTVEAVQLRNHLIQNFENASIAEASQRERLLTVVVVGGGPTGVEVSGAIADMRAYVLPKDYPELDFRQMKIYLLEGSPKTLGTMSEASSAQSRKYLEKLGVTVRTGTVVKEYNGEIVTLADGTTIASSTVIWAAGIKGNVPGGIQPDIIVRGNRIKTDRHNLVQHTENVYAIGDIAYMETPLYPHGHPQVAQVAMQQADTLAENLQRIESKSSLRYEFEYYDGIITIAGAGLLLDAVLRSLLLVADPGRRR